MKYYKLIVNSYYEPGGVMYAPKGTDISLIQDSKEVIGWETLIFTLQDGIYMPYHMCIGGSNLVNEELKKTIEKFTPADYPIEFLPVKTKSKEYGERVYYIMHFKIIFDVIDPNNTIYVPDTDSVIKICLNCNKVKGLNIFNSRPYVNDIIISDKLRKMIKKRNLDIGIQFSLLHCV